MRRRGVKRRSARGSIGVGAGVDNLIIDSSGDNLLVSAGNGVILVS